MTRAYNTATTQQNSGGAVAGVTAGKNFIINGGFDIWQRGTSVAESGSGGTASDYTADRWVFGGSGGSSATVSRQATGDTTNLPNIQYCGRFQRTAGNTDTSTLYFAQVLETVNSIPLTGKTVTLSFYARAGANYSSASSALNVTMTTGTGTDQAFFSFTGTSSIIGTSVTLTSSWQRFTITGTVATNSTQVRLYYSYGPTGTAGANDYFEVTGVQVEVGNVATPFSRAGGTIQGELAACQRYFQSIGGNTADENLGAGMVYSTTNSLINTTFQVPLRTAPSVAIATGGAVSDFRVYNSSATPFTPTAFSGFFGSSIYSTRPIVAVSSGGLVAGNATVLTSSNSNGKLWASAEL
jgi:hypothetical protein